MKIMLLFAIAAFLLTACQRELGSLYQCQTPKRFRTTYNNSFDFFSFHHDEATFSRFTSSGGDTLYGSYEVVGNQLYLTELGRSFRCTSMVQKDSASYVFLHAFDSSAVMNWSIEINGEIYHTDSAGVLQNYQYSDTAAFIFIRPLLLKAFRLPSKCKLVIFYTEPTEVSNPDFLEYTIRRKVIESKDGYTYKKVQVAKKI